MITLERVSKQFPNGRCAPRELDLEILDGEITVLIGPSGCGKTTTLRLINRLLEPSAGRVVIDGEDVALVDPVALRRRIGYVIQQIGLFPHLTVGANVATIPRLIGWNRARQEARIDELLDLVGLEPGVYRDRYPHELSGGQQQRVGVARALGADPPLLLMDEPFGALDPITRVRLQEELLAIQGGVRKTIVFVTHDIDEAVKLGDHIVILAEDGTLAQHATARDLLAKPASPFVESFVGADRALLLLSVTPVERTMLQPIESHDERAPTLDVHASVGDAFAFMVLHGTDRIAVVDAATGERLGVLTAHAIAQCGSAPASDESRD
ncbi:MAG TPA: ATP-binding cassette domain-containing protein [Acidimicrobiales bacterium]|nr:ATP-binding cassette domain-containing protein [Acidimicrobiales bacterium]